MNTNVSFLEPLEARIAPAVIIVTTLQDLTSPAHDTGSLRDAILLANASIGVADEIVFQKTGGGTPLKGTITLQSDLPAITDSLTISGPVPGKATGLVIDGHQHANLQITDGDVTLQDFTIKNGLAEKGGGILIDNPGNTITLTDLVITGNHAASATSALGGGIAILNGTVAISKSTISHNSATGLNSTVGAQSGGSAYGGGIYSMAILTIETSTIASNLAKGGNALASSPAAGGGAYGGGIDGDGATSQLTIENSLIAHNKVSGGNGGAAAAKSGAVGGDGGAGFGAGVGNPAGVLTITTSTITGNTGKGGVGGKGGSGADGQSGGDGGFGGIFTGGGVSSGAGGSAPTLTIEMSTISNNVVAGGKGGPGGAAGHGGAKPGRSHLDGFSSGGGISHAGGQGTITDSAITGNKALSAGGIGAISTNLDITNCTIAKNSASLVAGGIEFTVGALKIHNSTIAKNTAKSIGGIYAVSGSPTEIISTIIAGNKGKDDPDLSVFDGAAVVSYSLIQHVTTGSLLAAASHDNLLNVDPKLVKFGKNGGPTLNFLLAAGSPAIDKGSNPDALTDDQRGTGFLRTKGAATDIGATEIH